jgi:hypothetical protein
MRAFLQSIRCSPDGTGDMTIEAWDFQNHPISGVLVNISGTTATTGSDGRATISGLEAGRYSAHVSMDGYVNSTITFFVSCQKKEAPKPPEIVGGVEIIPLNLIVLEMTYNNDGTANVEFLVQDYYNDTIADAAVTISGIDNTFFTASDGTVIAYNVNEGSYVAIATKKGYSQDNATFAIKFETKVEPAAVTEPTPLVEEQTTIPYSNLCIPLLIILLIILFLFFLWKRRKKEEEKKPEGQPGQGQKTQDQPAPKPATPEAPKAQ